MSGEIDVEEKVITMHDALPESIRREMARMAGGRDPAPPPEGPGQVITLPAANLFLQGRDANRLAPRGLTRVNELAQAGVTVACASDNIQDPFVPTGSGDMLEIARWTLLAAHLGSHELARAFDMASVNPARLMGIDRDFGIRTGARADLLITAAEDAAALVAGGALERAVLFGGIRVAGAL